MVDAAEVDGPNEDQLRLGLIFFHFADSVFLKTEFLVFAIGSSIFHFNFSKVFN